MVVSKLRVPTDENGLVPAGEYFKRLALALREAQTRRRSEPHDGGHVKPVIGQDARARIALIGDGGVASSAAS